MGSRRKSTRSTVKNFSIKPDDDRKQGLPNKCLADEIARKSVSVQVILFPCGHCPIKFVDRDLMEEHEQKCHYTDISITSRDNEKNRREYEGRTSTCSEKNLLRKVNGLDRRTFGDSGGSAKYLHHPKCTITFVHDSQVQMMRNVPRKKGKKKKCRRSVNSTASHISSNDEVVCDSPSTCNSLITSPEKDLTEKNVNERTEGVIPENSDSIILAPSVASSGGRVTKNSENKLDEYLEELDEHLKASKDESKDAGQPTEARDVSSKPEEERKTDSISTSSEQFLVSTKLPLPKLRIFRCDDCKSLYPSLEKLREHHRDFHVTNVPQAPEEGVTAACPPSEGSADFKVIRALVNEVEILKKVFDKKTNELSVAPRHSLSIPALGIKSTACGSITLLKPKSVNSASSVKFLKIPEPKLPSRQVLVRYREDRAPPSVIVKDINTSKDQEFVQTKIKLGNLKCAYCGYSGFHNLNDVKQHISSYHGNFPHSGFAIENDSIKLIASRKISSVEPQNCFGSSTTENYPESDLAPASDLSSMSTNEIEIKNELEEIDADPREVYTTGDHLSRLHEGLPFARSAHNQSTEEQECPITADNFKPLSDRSNNTGTKVIASTTDIALLKRKRRSLVCPFCAEHFKKRSGLDKHIVKMHITSIEKEVMEQQAVKIFCEHCPSGTDPFLPDALKVHIKEAHPEFEDKLSLQEDEDFDIQDAIIDRSDVPVEEIPPKKDDSVRCNFCLKKYFTDWKELKSHIFLSHLGVDKVSESDDDENCETIPAYGNDGDREDNPRATENLIKLVDEKLISKNVKKYVMKSKQLINRAGIMDIFLDELQLKKPEKPSHVDPFNVSNDEHYAVKINKRKLLPSSMSKHLQHALFTVLPTHLDPEELRGFHRPHLTSDDLINDGFHAVRSLTSFIAERKRLRDAEAENVGGGLNYFYMKTVEDLSGKDGVMVLLEYSEEHPPLLSMNGMVSKIFNYSKNSKKRNDFGELIESPDLPPFLGQLRDGEMVQAIENRLFRAPIYRHEVPRTDFIVIVDGRGFSVRCADALMLCGQECPLMKVPKPESKLSITLLKNMMQFVVFRLFRDSKDDPKTLSMDDLKNAFPATSESALRKRLKFCSKFARTGKFANKWVLKDSFRLPTLPEIMDLVTAEDYCVYFSMLAGQQRLNDAGYFTESGILETDDAENLDDEVKCAPWNTTKAFIHAAEGRCLLKLKGPADPTGKARQGFSYEQMSNKVPESESQARPEESKKLVKQTEADLRKLPLRDAKEILIKEGFSIQDLSKLSRWEIVDLIRTLVAEKAKAGIVNEEMNKFFRDNPFSIEQHRDRYRRTCQELFHRQNRVLGSKETLDTDKEDSEEENELPRTKNHGPVLRITRIFVDDFGNETEDVEIVRQPQVIKMYLDFKKAKNSKEIQNFLEAEPLTEEELEKRKKEKRRVQEKVRRKKRKIESESVNDNVQLESNLISSQADENDASKIKKKSRKHSETPPESRPGMPPSVKQPLDVGVDSKWKTKPSEVANVTPHSCKQRLSKRRRLDPLVELTTFFVKLMSEIRSMRGSDPFWHPVSTKLVPDYLQKIKRPMDLGKIQTNLESSSYRSRQEFMDHINLIYDNCEFYNGSTHPLTVEAGKIKSLVSKKFHDNASLLAPLEKELNPHLLSAEDVLTKDESLRILSTIFQNVIDQKLKIPKEFWPFLVPVRLKDYSSVIKHPMDIEKLSLNVAALKYKNRSEFMKDVQLIYSNSALYNGDDSDYTVAAKKLVDVARESLSNSIGIIVTLEDKIRDQGFGRSLPQESETAETVKQKCESKIEPPQESVTLQCELCGKGFTQAANLRRHFTLAHRVMKSLTKPIKQEQEVRAIECPFCTNFTVPSWNELKLHVEQSHPWKTKGKKEISVVENLDSLLIDTIEIKEEPLEEFSVDFHDQSWV